MAGTVHQLWYVGLTEEKHKHKISEKARSSDEYQEGQSQQKQRNSRHRSYDFLLWQDYFRDPSQWWDNRKCKLGPACPDFKHKVTKDSLWIDDWFNPSWVDEELSRRLAHDTEVLQHKETVAHDSTPPGNDGATAFVALLRTCAKYKDLHTGTRVHDDILKEGLLKKCSDALVTMYAKCGELAKAQELLDRHTSRDIITWTALISGYAQKGQGAHALECFEQMKCEGLSPDAVTFACILKACGSLGAADKGEQIHDEIARQGLLENDIVLGTALVDMYVKCGSLAKAQQVFEKLSSRNVVTWSALITGYAQQDQGEQALKCFEQMQQEGLSPDAKTFACILKACGNVGAADKGEQIHDEISRQGLLGKDIVLGTAVVDMYAKCGYLVKARRVFEKLPSRDVTSWSALIAGYVQYNQGELALSCFERMQGEGLSPNAVTFSSILKACGSIGAIDKGKQLHDKIVRQGLLGSNFVLGTALVDMYAKCGALSQARQVLDELPHRDVSTWCALIAGYAQQGQGQQALNCFEQMQQDGLSPDAVTFSCVLNACSHLGLVNDGHMFFAIMSTKYGIAPDLDHYTCMVDLFGRAGHLDKAVAVIQEMPFSDYIEVWSALLGACRKWGDVNVGRWAFEHALQINKKNPAAYVLMADVYAAAGMQQDAETIEAMRLANEAWKRPGCSSWVDASGIVYAFLVGDTVCTKQILFWP